MTQYRSHRWPLSSRRGFLAGAAGACFGVGLWPMLDRRLAAAHAAAPNPSAKHVIYLYLAGGMSHIDTFDPKPDNSEVQGPTQVINTNVDGIRIGEYLPLMAKQMDKVAVLRSLTSKQGAHERGNYFMHTGYNPLATIRHPALGAWVTNLGGRINKTLPGNVVIAGGSNHPGAGFMDGLYAPLQIGNPADGLPNAKLPRGTTFDDLERRRKLADAFDKQFQSRYPHKDVKAYSDFYDEAVRLMKSEDIKAFDLSQEKPQIREMYGAERFGQGCLLARRLVEHGVRFVEVNLGGWDTHQDNFDRLPELCGTLDQALAALLDDLHQHGLLRTTMVVLATEFGRTPKINERDGRDHHPRVFTCLLAGGGVRGGQVYGASDDKGYAVADNELTIPDFNATIAYGLGLPLDKVVTSKSGRPFTIADKGKPVTAIF